MKKVKIKANTLWTGFLLVTTYKALKMVKNDNTKNGIGRFDNAPILLMIIPNLTLTHIDTFINFLNKLVFSIDELTTSKICINDSIG